MQELVDVQIDGMIGPTHHFGGLGVGNLASQSHRLQPSSPRRAALEGLAKMSLVSSLGTPQFFLPPLPRPDWQFLRQVGYSGPRAKILKRCGYESPSLLSAAYSSSFMWTANAATTVPSTDTWDGKAHALVANLCSSLHRGMEAEGRLRQFQGWFSDDATFTVHEALPSVSALRDEGAANHMRLSGSDALRTSLAVHVFVHEPTSEGQAPKTFIARQGRLASVQAAHILRLPRERCVFLEQSPRAVDAGVFHNDVVAMSHRNLLVCHEYAFVDQASGLARIAEMYTNLLQESLIAIEVSQSELPLEEAVQTYLFNSQILTRLDGGMHLICPIQCAHSANVVRLIDHWINDSHNPIASVDYVSLDQSMANGGGPACLRLRWPMREVDLQGMEAWRWTESNAEKVRAWVDAQYPDSLSFEDMMRVEFADHIEAALGHFPCPLPI